MNSPKDIAMNYIVVAQGKVSAPWYKTLILSILAGAFIALGGTLATVASSGSSGIQAALIKGAVFPLGLILVVICGAELFTGNCLLLAPTLNRDVKPTSVLRSLGIVYCGNLIGSVLIALLVVYSHAFGDAARIACVSTADAKCAMGIGDCLLRGILCNILVCLAVWASMASTDVAGKILAVYLPVFAFVVCGFEHSVANMYYLSAGLMGAAEFGIEAASLSFGSSLVNLVFATLGNVIGGCMIAAAYWATYLHKQKRKELKDDQSSYTSL